MLTLNEILVILRKRANERLNEKGMDIEKGDNEQVIISEYQELKKSVDLKKSEESSSPQSYSKKTQLLTKTK